jgi:hypothetical protein
MFFGATIIAALILTSLRDRSDSTFAQVALWRDPILPAAVSPPLAVPTVEPRLKPTPISRPKTVVAKADPNPRQDRPAPMPTPKTRPQAEVKNAARPESRPAPVRFVRAPASAEPSQPTPSRVRPAARRVSEVRVASTPSRRRSDIALAGLTGVQPANREKRPAGRHGRTATPSTTPVAKPRLAFAAVASPQRIDTQPLPSSTRRSNVTAAYSPPAKRASVEIGQAPAPSFSAGSRAYPATPRASKRTTPETTASGPARRSTSQTSLRGVALGSLASCMSDREEDLLKQRVLTAVRNRKDCASSKGNYRFVETKNLNAFSMWIEHTPGRRPSDRCVELTHALACLE